MSILARRAKHAEMAISEGQLRQLTSQLDDLHESTFPPLRKAFDELAANLGAVVRQPSTRRSFFLGTAGAVALGAAAACSSGQPAAPAASRTAASPPPPQETYPGDLKMVAVAAALENLAVSAYEEVLRKVGTGELGAVPPAVATFVQTAMKQHSDHAQAWNAALSRAGKPTLSDAPLSITQQQMAVLTAAKSVPDVAKFALNLENVAAQTYTAATTSLSEHTAIMTAVTIQPVETMHAAILNFVIGEYPIPDTFIGISTALKPDSLAVR
jgi:Ferritin-like domain